MSIFPFILLCTTKFRCKKLSGKVKFLYRQRRGRHFHFPRFPLTIPILGKKINTFCKKLPHTMSYSRHIPAKTAVNTKFYTAKSLLNSRLVKILHAICIPIARLRDNKDDFLFHQMLKLLIYLRHHIRIFFQLLFFFRKFCLRCFIDKIRVGKHSIHAL